MHTDPKSSVDILEHVTEGGVHVETHQASPDHPRSFESVVAVVETQTYAAVRPGEATPSPRRRDR